MEWGEAAGYTALLFGLSVLRYRLWYAWGLDLALYGQGLWLLTHRGISAVSSFTGHPILANSANYILLPLAPLYNLGGVYVLLLVQACAYGLGYVFIRGIARELGVGDGWAHLTGIVYFAYPTILAANISDFHPDALGVPILFGLALAACKGHRVAYGTLLAAALLVKDTVPIVLLGLSVALLLQGRAAWSALTGVIGLTSGYLDVEVIIPAVQHAPLVHWQPYYGSLGATPLQGVATLAHHPALLFAWAARVGAWASLGFLLGPFATLAVLLRARIINSWWLPGLALCEANLLSPEPLLSNPFNEMYVLAVPFFFVATLAGLRRVRPSLSHVPAVRGAVLAPVAVFLTLYVWVGAYGYLRSGHPPSPSAAAAAIAAVPRSAPVLAQDIVIAHVPPRPQMWATPVLLDGVDLPEGTYVILDPSLTMAELIPQSLLEQLLSQLANDGQAQMTFSQDHVIVYRLLRPLRFLPAHAPK